MLDENEDVIVLGRYWDAIVFDLYSEEPVILETDSESNIFMAKYDSEGNFLWAKNIEGSGAESKDFVYDAEKRPFGTNPLDIVSSSYDGGQITLVGDFNEELKLDDISLNANGNRLVFMGVMNTGTIVSIENEINIPSDFRLRQNYPNPFNPSTQISFDLPKSSQVVLTIYDIMGQRVGTISNEVYPAGRHSVSWNADGLASGTYIYQLTTDSFSETRKMTLVK
jgi:hypothetical protein